MVPRRSHPLHFYSSLGVSSFKCVFGGNFIFIFFSFLQSSGILHIEAGASRHEILGYICSAKFCCSCPLPPPEASGVLFFWIYVQRTYICLCTGWKAYKYIYARPKAWFSSLPDTATCSGADGHQEHYSHSFDPGFEQGEGE